MSENMALVQLLSGSNQERIEQIGSIMERSCKNRLEWFHPSVMVMNDDGRLYVLQGDITYWKRVVRGRVNLSSR